MKRINNYNNFKNISLINSDSLINNDEFQRYQKVYINILRKLNINLHYSSSYKLSISSLFIFVKKIIEIDETINIENNVENIVLITISSISLLVKEDKENTSKIVSLCNKNNISENDINKIMRLILSIKRLFSDVAKNFGKNIKYTIDMLSYTELFIPFINVTLSLINSKIIDALLFIDNSFNNIKDDDIKYKMILNRILHKLFIIINNNNKFQNVKNSNILRINDEFKSPMYKNNKIQL